MEGWWVLIFQPAGRNIYQIMQKSLTKSMYSICIDSQVHSIKFDQFKFVKFQAQFCVYIYGVSSLPYCDLYSQKCTSSKYINKDDSIYMQHSTIKSCNGQQRRCLVAIARKRRRDNKQKQTDKKHHIHKMHICHKKSH